MSGHRVLKDEEGKQDHVRRSSSTSRRRIAAGKKKERGDMRGIISRGISG